MVAAAETAGKVATFAMTVMAARQLGAAGFGGFAFALSFSMLLATLPHWGLSARLVKEGSEDRRRLPTLLTETVILRALLGAPVVAIGLAVAVLTRPDASSAAALVLVLVATLMDELFMDTGRTVADARQEQGWASRALILERTAQAILGIAALVAGFGLVGLSVGYLAGTAVGALAITRSLRRTGVTVRPGLVHRRSLLRSLRGTTAFAINAIVAMALFRVDQVMLSALKGDEALGPYAAAYRLIEMVMFISWAAARAVFPAMSASAEAWRVRHGVEQAIAGVAVLYMPFAVGLALEAEPVVRTLFGAGFVDQGVPAARWLAATPMLFAIGFLAIYAAVARGLRWAIVTPTAAGLAVNVATNLLLIPPLGGTGAAIATVVSYAVQAGVAVRLAAHAAGWPRLHRALAIPAAAALLMGTSLVLLRLALLPEVVLGAAVYGVAWLLLARRFAPEQLGMLRSVLGGGTR